MLMPGCVIMFRDPSGIRQFGQVVRMERCEIEFKLINRTDFGIIRNWYKACLNGSLTIVLPADTASLKKTISIPVKHLGRQPNLFDWVTAFLKGYHYVCDRRTGNWCLKSIVKGSLFIDGWFVPYAGQIIKQPIYIEHYNRIRHYESQLMNEIPILFISK